jgi:lipid II isoglutaminyl synthase (glutamine-hydrolysing)
VNTNQKITAKKGGFKNRLFKIDTAAAVTAGKLLIAVTRILGRGGTTLPGRVALRIKPDITAELSSQLARGSLVVTGTNGKTTTSALVTAILKESGTKCIHNQSGSNMSWGVASTLVDAASVTGKVNADYAVLEVDEGAFPGVVKSTNPLCVLITNIFRDQLDRYGEIDSIQQAIGRGLLELTTGSQEVINADDPSLVSLEKSAVSTRLTYGLEIELPSDGFGQTGRDVKTCPCCLKQLTYDRIYYAHLGHYHCPSCTFKRPEPDIKLTDYSVNDEGKTRLTVSHPDGELVFSYPLLGWYNLYNVLAATACGLALNIPGGVITAAIEKSAPSFGRMEQFNHMNREITMALIKNPVGANEVLRTVLNRPGSFTLLVAINDKIADGRDVSWLWDVDFEQLAAQEDKLKIVIASGLRAWDMAVRYKYAGISQNRIITVEDTAKALKSALELTEPGSRLFILPSYTAMLEIRRHLNKLGLGKPYWEER